MTKVSTFALGGTAVAPLGPPPRSGVLMRHRQK
jgi:hypothetical protein